MENRAYFALGDFFSNLMAGLLVGIASALCVDTGWNMLVAMFPIGFCPVLPQG